MELREEVVLSKKTWNKCVRNDVQLYGLRREWVQDRAEWKGSIFWNSPTHASLDTLPESVKSRAGMVTHSSIVA